MSKTRDRRVATTVAAWLSFSLAVASLSLATTTQPAAAAPVFATPTDLGTLGGASSAAVAINESGRVAGISNPTGSSDVHAFRWDPVGGMVDLGTLGGAWSNVIAMNESGTVLGRSATVSGATHGFVWDDIGGMTDIGTLGGAGTTEPKAINDSGVVVGASTYSGTFTHAFVWDSVGGIIDLGTLGGSWSGANGINEAGDVVGWSLLAGDTSYHAFVWNPIDGMTDLGTLGGSDSVATVINDAGDVAGLAQAPTGGMRAFTWNNTAGMVDLGGSSSYVAGVEDINDSGEVVGFGFDEFTQAIAFAANPNDGFAEIDGGPPRSVATDINSSGQVIGVTWGETVNQPFVWERGRGTRHLEAGTWGGNVDDITESGVVAGSIFVGGLTVSHAVIWEPSNAPTVSVGAARAVEGNSGTRTVVFSVSLSDPTTATVTVPYTVQTSTSQHAATAPAEFRAKSGTVTFKPSATTTKFISVPVYADTASEFDEPFVVRLGTPTGGYSLGVSVVTATILDDEAYSTSSVSVGDASVWEGDTGSKNYAKVYVTLDAPATSTSVVTVSVSGGTATAPGDFKAFTKTVTFAPGQYKKPLSILVKPDVVSEDDETVLVTLSNPSGVSLGRSVGTVTILSED